MGWKSNKSVDIITRNINGKSYRYAGRAKNKTELKAAKLFLKSKYKSVRGVKSKKAGLALYVRRK